MCAEEYLYVYGHLLAKEQAIWRPQGSHGVIFHLKWFVFSLKNIKQI